jgi:GNAT superfamily N-acetyltransferase
VYSDAFLDGDVLDDRRAEWTRRLREPDGRSQTLLAEDSTGQLIGFAHTVFEADPAWGALLDNLHVEYGRKRQGLGSELLVSTAGAVATRGTGLYLWVLEQNADAQAFYGARGARRVERAMTTPPGDVASRLVGSPAKLRYVWSDPAVLLG